MKKYSILFLLLFGTVGMSQQVELWSRVNMRSRLSVNEYKNQPWRNCISEEQKISFFGTLLDMVDSGIIKVYRPEPPYEFPLNKEEIHQVLWKSDSILTENPETGELITQISSSRTNWDHIVFASFREKWSIDPLTGTFQKQVLGVIPEVYIKDNYGSIISTKGLFYISFEMKSILDLPRYQSSRISLQTDQEQKLVALEKFPSGGHPFNPEKMFSLLSGFVNPKAALFDTLYPYDRKLSGKEKNQVLSLKTFIGEYMVMETWNFDPNNFQFVKQVHGITFRTSQGSSQKDLCFAALNQFTTTPLLPYPSGQVSVPFMGPIAFKYDYEIKSFPDAGLHQLAGYDSTALSQHFSHAVNAVMQGKKTAYSFYHPKLYNFTPSDPEPSKLTSKQLMGLMIRHDSVFVENDGPGEYQVLSDSLHHHFLDGLRFYEEWTFDSKTLQFQKNILALAFGYHHGEYGRTADMILIFPFVVLNDVGPTDKKPVFLSRATSKHLIDYGTQYPVEDTIMCVDVRNDLSNDIATLNRCKLIQSLILAANDGKIKCFDPISNAPIKKGAVLPLFLPYSDSTCKLSELPQEFRAVNYIEFEENWYTYTGTHSLYKEVRSITLINRREVQKGDSMEWEEKKILRIEFKPSKK